MVQNTAARPKLLGGRASKTFTYDLWMEEQGIPIYRGFYIEDLRKVELKPWALRGCDTAFIQLMGMEGVNECRVSEIPPGATLPPFKLEVDETVYVLQGRGLTTVWRGNDGAKRTFEWQPHSMFLIPRGYRHQISNTRGDQPVRLLHYNYMPVMMSAIDDPDFFFNNPYERRDAVDEESMYAEAKVMADDTGTLGPRNVWYGNFFPDMRAWDKLDPFRGRGAGGHVVFIQFAGSPMWCHMSVFPAKTYKKAHRHGPGRAIVIPGGEGYSIMWQEGQEKIVVNWHEASLFTPPGGWFHQHFNVGGSPGRYLALHPMHQFAGHSEQVADRARDQIEYPQEDPWIREKFEGELARRNLTSLMPDQAYRDLNFEWDYSSKN